MEMSFDDFKDKFPNEDIREELTTLVQHSQDDDNMLFVFYPKAEQAGKGIGVKPIRDAIIKMKEGGVHRAILVLQTKMTSFAKQAASEFAPKWILEDFQETELLVNIMQHVLVPKHQAMSEEEKKKLLSRYKLRDSQLPR